MPITGRGWEFHIERNSVQRRSNGRQRERTVGRYRVFHDGEPQTGPSMSGTIAESKGPGANRPAENGRRVEEGRYPLATHGFQGSRYCTIGYDPNSTHRRGLKPALLLRNTEARTGILIHPGENFLSSVGCFNPCTSLPDAAEMIDWDGSMRRTIRIIDDLSAYLGNSFPRSNGVAIPRAHFVIDGEP